MKKINDYQHCHYIGSVSFSEDTNKYLIECGLNPIFIDKDTFYLVNESLKFSMNEELKDYICHLNELDVIEILPNGVIRHVVNQKGDDATLFITEKCNSNCIMCPYSETIRKNGTIPNIDVLIQMAKHFPKDLKHVTITGGEPFIIKENLFDILNIYKHKYDEQEILLLTNGRVFCMDKYVTKLTMYSPNSLVLGIPLHGHTAELHDSISGVNDSFNQTCSGISKLLKNHIFVELRIVVSKINYKYLTQIAKYISEHFPSVFRVVFVGLEMVGNAAVNKDKVWISYKESAPYIQEAIELLVNSGITTKVYNYPLCTIEKKYWDICARSISDYKVTFADICNECIVKKICGGVFNGTFNIEKDEIEPIRGTV